MGLNYLNMNTNGFNFLNGSCAGFGFTGFGNVDYNAMAGYGVANSLMNIFSQAATVLIAESKATSSTSLTNDINALDQQVGAQLKRISNTATLENYADYSVRNESWYIDQKVNLETERTNAQKNVLSDTDKAGCEKTLKDLEDLKTKLLNAPEEEKAGIETQIKNLEKTAEVAKERLENHKKALDALKLLEQKEKDLEQKADNEQAVVNDAIAKINELLVQREKIQGTLDQKVLKKADGNSLTRLSDEEYNKQFDKNGKFTGNVATKATVKKAIYNYSKATAEEKVKIKQQIKDLWAKLPKEDRTKSLEQAYYLICPEDK